MHVNIDVEGYISNFLTAPEEGNIISGFTRAYCLKHDNILVIAWVRLQWHVVIETWEENVVVKIVIE